ncbi:MAG: enoyl-CoA hydratase, partial [Microvirga sp.]
MTVHATADASPLLRSDAGGIVTLTLNRPAARNALSEALIDALTHELDRIAADAAARVVMLTAAGPAFSSGHDLKEMTAHRADPDRGRAYFTEIMARCSAMMERIVRLPQPVIAIVEGIATAAGCQLAASCDLAVAGANARFATPGVHIGLFCSTPMVALSRKVLQKHAMEMLLTGEPVSAARAHAIGLVNSVHRADEMDEAVGLVAGLIASKSLMTLSTGKEAFYRQADMSLPDAY